MFRSIAVLLICAPLAVAGPSIVLVDGNIVVSGVKSAKGLSVYVADGTEEQIAARPAMGGTWSFDAGKATFTPKYPLSAGVRYRVLGADEPLHVRTPDVKAAKPTIVNRIYPTDTEIPENILRFYIEFNQPMPRGDAYHYVRIHTAKGDKVEQPFLELDDELWNADQTRLTLVIDPGRLKKEVKPRLDLGPVFEKGQKYTLVISGKWPTLGGKTLGVDTQRPLTVGAPVADGLDPMKWRVTAPGKDKEPLTIAFDRLMDHALASKSLTVFGPNGSPIEGKVELTDRDRQWRFQPAQSWTAGEYTIQIKGVLEDVCGNGINRPFETSADAVLQSEKPRDAELKFRVRP